MLKAIFGSSEEAGDRAPGAAREARDGTLVRPRSDAERDAIAKRLKAGFAALGARPLPRGPAAERR